MSRNIPCRLRHALLLDATFNPITIVSWQRAITLVVGQKARLLEAQGVLTAERWQVSVPSVLVLMRYFRKGLARKPPFTRRNVYLRDHYTCQYCGRRFDSGRGLTLDHVIPRARGGTSTWKNVVAACESCNALKAARTLREAGIRLSRPPEQPRWLPQRLPRWGDDIPQEWRNYLPNTDNNSPRAA